MEIQPWKPKETIDKYLKQWDAFTMIENGMSRCGKTYLMKHIITPYVTQKNKNQPKFDFVIVFSKTICNGFYQNWLSEEGVGTEFLFDDFKEEIVYKFKNIVQEYRNPNIMQKLSGQTPKNIKTLFILDDCLSTSFKFENAIGDLFVSGRHWGASVIILGQKASFYNLSWQCNCLIFISMFCGSFKEKKYISENIISDVIDVDNSDLKMSELFRKAFNLQTEYCKDYNALIILPLEHKIMQYKAPSAK